MKALTIKKQLEAEKKRTAILFDVIEEIVGIALDKKDDLRNLLGNITVRKPYARAAQKLNLADDFLADIAVREQYARELMDADPEQLLTKYSESRQVEEPEDEEAETDWWQRQIEWQERNYKRIAETNRKIAEICRKNFEFKLG